MMRFAPIVILLFVAGCTILQSNAPPQQIYYLRATGQESTSGSAQPLASQPTHSSDGIAPLPSILVSRPTADPGLGSELIMLVRSDNRLDYFAASRWAADLPEVVETLAIDTLRESGHWSAVHEAPSPYLADYLLDINIRRFEADYTAATNGVPRVNVVLDCTVAHRRGRDVITTFVAESAVQATENRLAAVVAAFQQAANEALAIVAKRSAEAARSSG
ncbi:MAG: membrane integrity-associated transporter subunit PqiC [Steroidobacteraceae bacterium]|nr:membrane integrity-associated transporter subunit PqiC [Steroidobacteraceae bacterium]